MEVIGSAIQKIFEKDSEDRAANYLKNNKSLIIVGDGSWSHRRNPNEGSYTIWTLKIKK